jgi:hypothetical protein
MSQWRSSVPLWANEAIGGWELSGLPSWHTGTPYMANSVAFLMSYSNEDPAILTGSLGPMQSHVTVQNGQVYAFKDYAKAHNQYTGPVGFQMGSRNNLRGPGYFDLDLGLGKTFPLYKEGVNLKFRVDAFNALNHPNFQSPSFQNNMSLVAAPNEFGVIPGTVIPNGSDQGCPCPAGRTASRVLEPLRDFFGPAKIKPESPPGSTSARGALSLLHRVPDRSRVHGRTIVMGSGGTQNKRSGRAYRGLV